MFKFHVFFLISLLLYLIFRVNGQNYTILDENSFNECNFFTFILLKDFFIKCFHFVYLFYLLQKTRLLPEYKLKILKNLNIES